jgi:hypothetical protein
MTPDQQSEAGEPEVTGTAAQGSDADPQSQPPDDSDGESGGAKTDTKWQGKPSTKWQGDPNAKPQG